MHDRETFLLIEEQALVQLDMSQAILELYPDATILQARSISQAERLLEATDSLTGAISGMGVGATKESGLGARIDRMGAWLICLNGHHTDRIVAEGWHPLARPFSSEDLQRLIHSLGELQRQSPAAG